jgi:hypothetical protein
LKPQTAQPLVGDRRKGLCCLRKRNASHLSDGSKNLFCNLLKSTISSHYTDKGDMCDRRESADGAAKVPRQKEFLL